MAVRTPNHKLHFCPIDRSPIDPSPPGSCVPAECAPASGRKQMFTGSARKLRDTAADWHNLMLKWERLGDEGSAAATRIVNLSVSKRAEKDVDITAEDDTSFVNERSGNEVSSKLYESYKQELALKQTIVKEIAHTSDPDLLLVYLSSWLHQPYIEDNTKLLLESLLLETMHRTLLFAGQMFLYQVHWSKIGFDTAENNLRLEGHSLRLAGGQWSAVPGTGRRCPLLLLLLRRFRHPGVGLALRSFQLLLRQMLHELLLLLRC
ncbi:cyclin-dependent kinase 2-interacting protein-like [Scleropages formosus]|uniref:Cyclin-dependent kinase 2-interacting protein-like n=1 Tax=Scleropages formosus TaxID=113540 RepID=A0A0P7UP34_SCLFO|nr:cyclin-dependent kinase 2-interacting protein-like [Scleropages formosus]